MDDEYKRDRWAAARAGDVFYYTGTPCKHGHDAPRYVATGVCRTCAIKRAADRNAAFKQAMREARAS